MEFEKEWGSFDRAATALDEQLQVKLGDRVQCCVALTAAFYVRDGHTPKVRSRMAEAFAVYRRAVGDGALVWGIDPRSGKPKQIDRTRWLLDIQDWLPRLAERDAFEAIYRGAAKKEDASACMFQAFSPSGAPNEPSALTFALPLVWGGGREQGAYLKLILQIAQLLQAIHGYAGLGIVLRPREYGDSPDMEPVIALAKRFRGLELDFAALQTGDLGAKIKGINWLTVLGDSFVEQLGGAERLKAGVSDDVSLHLFEGGLVIQAGVQPRFGDVNRAEPMEAYESVAAALKPIRATEIRAFTGPSMDFGEEGTARWLTRFDRE
jgi:Protein of unknown function (DUF3396)